MASYWKKQNKAPVPNGWVDILAQACNALLLSESLTKEYR